MISMTIWKKQNYGDSIKMINGCQKLGGRQRDEQAEHKEFCKAMKILYMIPQ